MSKTIPRTAANLRKRKLFIWQGLGVLIVVCLAGCATSIKQYWHNGMKVGPNYGTPPAPVAATWIDQDDQRVRTYDARSAQDYWAAFGDPVLNELVAEAYRQNLTLRQAGFRVLEARAARNIQAGNLFAQAQNMFGGYSRNAASTANANTNFIQQPFYNQLNVGFNLSWELDFWGRFRRAVEAADADLNASIEAYDDVMVTLIGEVATTYVEIRSLQAELEITNSNIELQKETFRIASARYKAGKTTELDPNQAEANLTQTQSDIPQLETQLRAANVQLCALLGLPPEDIQKHLGPGPIPVAPPQLAVGIPAQLLTRRPDVRRAERQCAAQCARIGIAEADLYPHLMINGSLGYSSENLSSLFQPQAFQAGIAPQFQWAILNYGRLQNNIRLNEAKFQELIAGYQNVVIKAQGEVEKGLNLYINSHLRTQFLATSVEKSQQSVKIALRQFEEGAIDFNRVVLAEQNLLTRQNEKVSAQRNIALGMIYTYRALGGGWDYRQTMRPPVEVIVENPVNPAIEAIPLPNPQPNPAEQAVPELNEANKSGIASSNGNIAVAFEADLPSVVKQREGSQTATTPSARAFSSVAAPPAEKKPTVQLRVKQQPSTDESNNPNPASSEKMDTVELGRVSRIRLR